METSFASLIDSATSVLVLLPTKPYFDQVAAGLSLYLSIKGKKEVNISCPSPMMVGFNRIIGVNKISSELGNKNLTIKFKGYDAANIEKVSYDIIDGEFNLTVVPKTGTIAPQKEQLDLSFSGISSDLIILIGGANDTHFPILTSPDLAKANIIHIGNRDLVSGRSVVSFAKPGSSTSELVANVIKENGMSMDSDIATNLLMGIEDASSNFTTNEVTADTFETVAYLLRSGGQRQSRVRLSPIGFPPGAIPSQPFNQPVQNPVPSTQPQPIPQPTFQQVPAVNPEPVLEQVENKEEMAIENPPDDWLQPKVFKGSSTPMNQPTSFSENKG